MSELKNTPRSGGIRVRGSRQFKDFSEYSVLKRSSLRQLPLAVAVDCDPYLQGRLSLLEQHRALVNRLAGADELPDVFITIESGLMITPLGKVAPETAQTFID